MPLTGLLLGLVGAASADELNREPLVGLALVHQGGSDRAWGVEVGTARLYALGDPCTWGESDCRSGTWWPVAGARAAVSWRGGTRFGAALEAIGGVAAVDMFHVGFFPIAALEAAAGALVEVGERPALSFGGTVTKSLSYRERTPITGGYAYRDHGLPMVSGAFAARGLWDGDLRPMRWTAGLELAPVGMTYQ